MSEQLIEVLLLIPSLRVAEEPPLAPKTMGSPGVMAISLQSSFFGFEFSGAIGG